MTSKCKHCGHDDEMHQDIDVPMKCHQCKCEKFEGSEPSEDVDMTKYPYFAKEKKGLFGENARAWKGGIRKTRDGYLEIYSPHHPNKNKNNCVLEHRLVMERYLGRFLTKKEVVHHIDKNKENNDIENLELFSSVGTHTQTHHIVRDTKGRFKKHE